MSFRSGSAKPQAVTGICGRGGGPAALWEGGVLYDLNTLVPPDSGFFIAGVNFINDRGEIAATGFLPNGDEHALLLIPCDVDHAEIKGCENARDFSAEIVQNPVSTPKITANFIDRGNSAMRSPRIGPRFARGGP